MRSWQELVASPHVGQAPAIDQTALAATLATVDRRSTIRPGALDATRPDTAVTPAAAGLSPFADRLVLGTTIGEGGMAVVRIAKQTSLGREVAVKVLREDAADSASPRMLREAWITGTLEHPNIVPVHDLGVDGDGRPMLVLKRIEGRPWSELIGKRDEIRARFGMDALEWNLQQLVHVCHAVAFAHSRGIVHRDLKPANIMIGGFGEVYVLDWGIAVSLIDDGTGRLPLASQCNELAGTLAYMAPEMLGPGPIAEQTDVYLLGAMLYEIVAGTPPHMRESVSATLESIMRSKPVLSTDA
jgi:eukaryotic-like serine/threonine-protein kinase